MSRMVRGEPPTFVGTSAAFNFNPEPTLKKLVDVICDDCGAKAITFGKDGPPGWTLRMFYWRTMDQDLCPDCSAKPEPPGDGSTYA